jgi:CO/xanthine dehydrogenase Mo-binding subunit
MSEEFRLLGKWKGRRLDGIAKLTGQLQLGADWNRPNMAYMRTKLSTIPSGTITAMDASAARAMPGVLAVVTPDDVKNNPEWSKIKVGPSPLLPYDKVRSAGGEVIAAVVAENPSIAEEACQKINVTYQASPFVLAPEDAMKDNAPEVWDGTSNLRPTVTYKFGDVDAAMNEPGTQVISGRYESQFMQHNNVCSYAFTLSADTDGRVEMWTAVQTTKSHQVEMGKALGVSASRVRVYNNSADGGFGDKGDVYTYSCLRPHILAALLSRQLGRPIHWRATHEENLLMGLHRQKVVFYIDTAVKNDGTVTALKAKVYGTSGSLQTSAASGCASLLYQVYKFPNFQADANDVWSNLPRVGPMRMPTGPQPAFALGTHMDKIAATLGMNPVDLMQKNNMYQKGDKDQLTGYRIYSHGQPDCLNRVLELSGFQQKWKPFDKNKSLKGVVHGIGIANMAQGNGASPSATSAAVTFQADGSVNILCDANSVGGGRREQLILMAAETLGLPFGMVTCNNYDSDAGTDVGPTVGSRQTKASGNPVTLACIDAKNQMLERAATMLSTTSDKLTYALDGSMKVYVTSDPTKSVTFEQLAGNPRIVGVGYMKVPTGAKGNVYNSCVAEVDVDTDTGLVKVTDVYLVEDVGRVIFRSGCETQIKGAIHFGLGMALQEDQWPDIPTGKQLQTSHLDVKLPLVTQTPHMVVDFVENPDAFEDSPNFGAKGLGEPPLDPPVPAIANAIYNAVGVRIDTLPITPEKILTALGKA